MTRVTLIGNNYCMWVNLGLASRHRFSAAPSRRRAAHSRSSHDQSRRRQYADPSAQGNRGRAARDRHHPARAPALAAVRPVPDPVRRRQHLRHGHPRHLPDPARPVAVAGRRRDRRRRPGGVPVPDADGALRSADRYQQRRLVRSPLRRTRAGARLVPVAAHRDLVLLDLGLGQRRRPGRRADPALRRTRLRRPARRHLRPARLDGHRRGRLRLRLHAPGQQGRRHREHRPDRARRRGVLREDRPRASIPARTPTRSAASGPPSCCPR